MMRKSIRFRSSVGLGAARIRSTVWLSILRTSFTPATKICIVPCGWRMRSKLKTTSSAVKGVPSWKRTPRRSSKRICVGPSVVHLVASAGSTW